MKWSAMTWSAASRSANATLTSTCSENLCEKDGPDITSQPSHPRKLSAIWRLASLEQDLHIWTTLWSRWVNTLSLSNRLSFRASCAIQAKNLRSSTLLCSKRLPSRSKKSTCRYAQSTPSACPVNREWTAWSCCRNSKLLSVKRSATFKATSKSSSHSRRNDKTWI